MVFETQTLVQRETQPRGLAEQDCAVNRMATELRRIRAITIFLAKGVMRMQKARREAIALSPHDCKQYLTWDFPVIQGPNAESTIERFAKLSDPEAERSESRYLGKAGSRESKGWIPVEYRYPGSQPYTWSRSVLVLLNTGGMAISSYFDHPNQEGQWLGLDTGMGQVTHWHELPPLPRRGDPLEEVIWI